MRHYVPSRLLVTVAVVAATLGALFPSSGVLGNGTTDWPQIGFEAGRTGRNSLETTLSPGNVADLVEAWKAPLWVPERDFRESLVDNSPVVAGGTVFLTTGGPYDQNAVAAFSRSDGALMWRTPLERIAAPPAVSDGTVYVNTLVEVVALDAATGDVLWNTTTVGGYCCDPRETAPPLVAGGQLFVTTLGTLWAIDRASGEVQWTTDTDDPFLLSRNAIESGPSAAGGRVFVMKGYERLAAFDAADGSRLWTSKLVRPWKGSNRWTNMPVTSGDVVFATITREQRWRVFKGCLGAFDAASGDQLWLRNLRRPVDAMALSGEILVAKVGDRKIFAFDATSGQRLWTSPVSPLAYIGYERMGFLIDVESTLSVANGVVFAGTSLGSQWNPRRRMGGVAAFDLTTGERLFWFQAVGPVPGSPAIVDGTLLFSCDTRRTSYNRQVGYLYAMTLP